MNKRVCCLSKSIITLWCMLAMSLYAQRETYTYDLTFSTTNQCMWRTGTCGTGVVSYFLGLPFNHSGSGGGFFSVPLLGEFGIRGSASARGRIGLLFQAEATGGDVSVIYPMQISFSVPTREYLVPGGIVVVESSYRLNQGAQMTTRSPDAWASMSGVLEFQGSFSIRARAFSEDILNRSLTVPTLNHNQQLFHTSNINIWDRDFDLLSNYPGVLVLNLHYPRIATAAGNPSNSSVTKLTSTGRDRVVTLTGDLTAATVYLVQTLLGLPVGINWLNQSYSLGPASAGYTVAQAQVRTTLGFQQDFEFSPRPKIRLTFSDGRAPIEFYAGERAEFRMPMAGNLTVNASVVMDNQFKNVTSVYIQGGIYFLPLKVWAEGAIGDISLGSFTFQPVDELSAEASVPFQVFTRTFTLAGFTDQNLRPLSLFANTDATPGIFYSANYNSPTFARVGDPNTTITLECRPVDYFTSGSHVMFRGSPLAGTLVTQGVLRATIPASLLGAISNETLIVRTPGKPDTNALLFPVGYKSPQLAEVWDPNFYQRFTGFTIGDDSTDRTLEIRGNNNSFYQNITVVYWNDQPLQITQFNNQNNLLVRVPIEYLQRPQQVVIKVVNPPVGGGAATWNAAVFSPAPEFAESNPLYPSSGNAVGRQGLTIEVRGARFVKDNSVVRFSPPNQTNQWYNLETQFISSTKLLAKIPANLLGTAGNALVDVQNQAPGGGFTGNAKVFVVTNPVAFVERCEPNVVNRGATPPNPVRVLGIGFLPTSQIRFNGSPVTTTYVSATELRFSLPAGTMNTGRINTVVVRNPAPGGGDSNEEWFTVLNPKPRLFTLSPNWATTFAPPFQMTIDGSGFESTARAYWGAIPLTTHFVNAGRVQATVPTNLLRYAGTVAITVRNEPSEPSHALTFTVIEPTSRIWFGDRIWYVKPDGNDAHDGLSWETAKRTVQAAINSATPNIAGGAQVWVKAGTYNERITLKSGVHLYGGFAGNETDRLQRDLFNNESVLDGGEGGTVVTIPASVSGTTLDGFTIRRGRAMEGAGVRIDPSNEVVISNNLITQNSAPSGGFGTGIFVNGSSPRILNNVITYNNATHSAGVYLVNSSAQLVNNTIAYNGSTSPTTGGAVFVSDNSSVLMANNIVGFQTVGSAIERKAVGSASVILRNNCVFGVGTGYLLYKNLSPGATDIQQNPNFVNPAANDFRLGNSPCIDVGNNADAWDIPVDFDGQNRLNGFAIDIGADEVHPTNATLTLTTPTSARIREPVTFRATLRRTDNNLPIAGVSVNFVLEGNLIGAGTTNSSGQASTTYTLPESLGIGTKTVRAEFAGSPAYNPATATQPLTVMHGATATVLLLQPTQASVNQTIQVGGILRDGYLGEPIANRALTIEINRIGIGTVQTDAQGIATLDYTLPRGFTRGNHTVTVGFGGDTLFYGSYANGTLTIVNSPPEASFAGANLLFNGTNSHVVIPHHPALNSYPLAISCWVRTLDTSDLERGIVTKYSSGSGNGYQIYLRGGRVRAWYFRDLGNYIWDGAFGLDGGSIADGYWHHIHFVVDNSGGRLYVDGQLRASRAWTGSAGACSTTTPLMIGRYPGTPFNGHFLGEIDEVKIWSASITDLLPSSRQASLIGNEENLLAYYRLDEWSGNLTADATANGFHGTLVNNPLWQVSSAPVTTLFVVRGQPRTTRLNAYDYNGDPLQFTAINTTAGGLWIGTSFPNATFIPNAGGGASGAFNYQVNDGATNSNTASGQIQQFTQPVSGLGGSMRYFNGDTNSLVRVSNFGQIAPTEEMTIEFWQLVSAPRLSATIDINGSTANNRIVVHSPWEGGNVVFDFGNWTTQGRLAYVPPDNIVGTWQHFAFVVSRSGNYMRIYRNGVLEAQKVGMTPFTRGNFDLTIGVGASGPQGFQGFLDEVRIWSRARSQREIQRDMQAVLRGSEPGLIGYWRMDEWTGAIAFDSSPSGRHGTYTNARWLASTAPIDTVHSVMSEPRTFTLGAFAEYRTDPNQLTYSVIQPPSQGTLNTTNNTATYTPAQPGVFPMRYRAVDGFTASVPSTVWLRVGVPGDVDGNGCVDDGDLLLVLFSFGSADPDSDLNQDGTVDDADLLVVLFNFGMGC